MKYIKVMNVRYTDPSVSTPNGPATPMAYPPNPWEGFIHWLGFHFTFGQPFCVVCLKKGV